jgi:hypothetical protein
MNVNFKYNICTVDLQFETPHHSRGNPPTNRRTQRVIRLIIVSDTVRPSACEHSRTAGNGAYACNFHHILLLILFHFL